MAQQISVKDVIGYYSDTFVGAYADLVSLTGDKPTQVLVEIENFNSHLIKALEGTEVDTNLSRARGHLQRGALDCYKLIFVEINSRIKDYVRGLTVTDVEFALGPMYREHLREWYRFSEQIREARRNEVASTGSDRLEDAILNYKAAVDHGFNFLKDMADSEPRLAEVRHHLFWSSFKSHWPYHLAEIAASAMLAWFAHGWAIGEPIIRIPEAASASQNTTAPSTPPKALESVAKADSQSALTLPKIPKNSDSHGAPKQPKP